MTTQLTFQSTTLQTINRNSQTYITASDLARALQYKSVDAVTKIYTRNEDEFTADMSDTVKLTVSGNLQTTTRIFSLRGAHLIAMFARTPVAKDFRKWVLDILDREVSQNPQPNLPLVEEKKYTFEFTEDTCLRFVSLWFALYNNLALLGQLHQPLSHIGSHFDSTAYTHYTEYQTILGTMKSVLEPMTEAFNPDPRHDTHYYKALRTLRNYQAKGLATLVKHPTPPTRKYDF